MPLLLICIEMWAENGRFLHRKLTHLLLPRYLKRLLFALLGTGHFLVAKVGSIRRANQQTIITCAQKNGFSHGLNERIALSNIRPGITYYLSVFRELSSQ